MEDEPGSRSSTDTEDTTPVDAATSTTADAGATTSPNISSKGLPLATGDDASQSPVIPATAEKEPTDPPLDGTGSPARKKAPSAPPVNSSASPPPPEEKESDAFVETVIKQQLPNDVVCGRGTTGFHHEGNKVYRQLLKEHPRGPAPKAGEVIVKAVLGKQGRFIRYDPERQVWLDIGYDHALKKTVKALRKSRRSVAKKLALQREQQEQLQQQVEKGGDIASAPTARAPEGGSSKEADSSGVAGKASTKKREVAVAAATPAATIIPVSTRKKAPLSSSVVKSKVKKAATKRKTAGDGSSFSTEKKTSPIASTPSKLPKKRSRSEGGVAGETHNNTATSVSPTHRLMIPPPSPTITIPPAAAAAAAMSSAGTSAGRLSTNQATSVPHPAAAAEGAPTSSEILMARYAMLQDLLDGGMSPAEAAAKAVYFGDAPVREESSGQPSLEQQHRQQQLQQQQRQQQQQQQALSAFASSQLGPMEMALMANSSGRMGGWGVDLSHTNLHQPNMGSYSHLLQGATLLDHSFPSQLLHHRHPEYHALGAGVGLGAQGVGIGGDSALEAGENSDGRDFVPYIEQNWDRLLQHCYEDIPETRFPPPTFRPNATKPKQDSEDDKNESSDNEEEKQEVENGEEREEDAANDTPTVYTFDDGRKWKVERVQHMVILSPYLSSDA